MFFGEFEHALDEKGRIFLPAKHRDQLGEVVMLVRGADGQINVYPTGVWEQAAETVRQQNQTHGMARNLSRIFFAASECQVDRQGRIVVPASLRSHAGLDTDVVIVGLDNHLEIWSKERWQELTAHLLQEGSSILEHMGELGVKL